MERASEQVWQVEDHFHGALTVENQVGRRVRVAGAGVPTVVVERLGDEEPLDHVPVGTRDAGRLRMTVDGREVALSLGKGGFRRRTYRVDVHDAAPRVHHRFQPGSLATSWLARDGRRLGELSVDEDVVAEWAEGEPVGADDAAVGYALAAAFGTGAQTALMVLVELVAVGTPG